MRKFSLLLLFIFLPIAIFCDPLPLVELVDIALKNNPETEKAWAGTKRAQAILGIEKSNNYPSVDLKGTLSHGREVKFPNGPETIFTNYGAEISLSYLLFDFGERSASIQATREALKAVNWSADFSIQKVIYKVVSSYYEYLDAKEILEVKSDSFKDAELICESAKELHKAGLRSITDLDASRAMVAEMQMEIVQQKAKVAISYGRLLTSMGLPLKTNLDIQTSPQGIKTQLFAESLETLISIAEEQRADLFAKKSEIASAKERMKKANRAPLPKVRTFGQGGWFEYAKHQDSGYNYNAGISLDIPLFKGFEYTYKKKLALAEEESSLAELKELKDSIVLDVLIYSESAKAAQESLTLSDAYLEEATKSYEGSLESYKAGLQSVFDLMQMQRSLTNARMKKTTAKTLWLISLAELAFATGSTL